MAGRSNINVKYLITIYINLVGYFTITFESSEKYSIFRIFYINGQHGPASKDFFGYDQKAVNWRISVQLISV